MAHGMQMARWPVDQEGGHRVLGATFAPELSKCPETHCEMATDGLYAMCRCAYRLFPCSYDVLKVSAIFLSQNRVKMHKPNSELNVRATTVLSAYFFEVLLSAVHYTYSLRRVTQLLISVCAPVRNVVQLFTACSPLQLY